MTHLTMPFVDREKLGVDLIKMQWTPEIVNTARPGLMEELKTMIANAGTGRVILSRVDTDQAVEVGRIMGVHMFQGRYVDRLISERSSPPSGRR